MHLQPGEKWDIIFFRVMRLLIFYNHERVFVTAIKER